MAKASDGLTPKQRRFAKEYVMSGNGTKAAKKAGYSKRSAHVAACRTLKNDNVKAFIDSLGAEAEAVRGLTQEQIAAMLLDDARNAKEGGTRVRAKELLGKWKNMFTERYEDITARDNDPLTILRAIDKMDRESACVLAHRMGIAWPPEDAENQLTH